jgi:hypothetical protein
MSNQWKENGDCKSCTKRGNCTKVCAARRRRTGEVDTRIKHREVLYVLASV